MTAPIEKLKKERIFFLSLIENLSTAQLNEVPAGFNNNVLWNLGHMLITQQSIIYLRAGLPIGLDEKYMLLFKPGTKPEDFLEADAIREMKALFLSAIDLLEQDCNLDKFSGYAPWKTRYGMEINNINDALEFVLFHEGLHIGYTMALKHVISPVF